LRHLAKDHVDGYVQQSAANSTPNSGASLAITSRTDDLIKPTRLSIGHCF